MATEACSEILEKAYRFADSRLTKRLVADADLGGRIAYAALCPSNRAGARFLLAATLAKIHKPTVDIRKPFIQAYADAEKANAYGGRHYDELYVASFITRHKLPCSSTTAFLTPAFRTKNIVLDLSQKLRGRPPELYDAILYVLDAIESGRASANDVLRELVRVLVVEREDRKARLDILKQGLREQSDDLALSSEDTVRLIEQHLALKYSARLPVLVVAAAYTAASQRLGEKILGLNAHRAADGQTGALGDVEITLLGDDKVVTTYEMKDKPVTVDDVDIAIRKIADGADVQNYIFYRAS